jgi:hypothetical protein
MRFSKNKDKIKEKKRRFETEKPDIIFDRL